MRCFCYVFHFVPQEFSFFCSVWPKYRVYLLCEHPLNVVSLATMNYNWCLLVVGAFVSRWARLFSILQRDVVRPLGGGADPSGRRCHAPEFWSPLSHAEEENIPLSGPSLDCEHTGHRAAQHQRRFHSKEDSDSCEQCAQSIGGIK